MAIDRGPWNTLADDDGSNTVGTLWNKAAIKTVLLDPIDAIDAIVSVPFTAADFAAVGGGAWSVAAGNIVGYKYSRVNKHAVLSLHVANSTLTSTPVLLTVKSPLPAGPMRTYLSGHLYVGSINEMLLGYYDPADGLIYCHRNNAALFPTGVVTEIAFTLPLLLT